MPYSDSVLRPDFRHDPSSGPMKVVFFFSVGASSMKAVLESPSHGMDYEVIGALTNRSPEQAEKGYGLAREHGIRLCYKDPSGYGTREEFYWDVSKAVHEMEPDVIGLSGWLKKFSIISDPLLSEYANRIINVHPADLSVIYNPCSDNDHPIDIGRKGLRMRSHRGWNDAYGRETGAINNSWELISKHGWRRMMTGDDAVTLACLLGEKKVRSTIHGVTEECYGGPILVQSKELEVDAPYVEKQMRRNAFDKIAAHAKELQDRMKIECDGPAFCRALELLGSGSMGIDGDHATLYGDPLPYGGYQMDG